MSVVTGEAVALDLRVAQLPSRVVAALIDFAVMAVAFGVLGGIAGQLVAVDDSAAAAALTIVVVVLVFLGYPLVFETLSRGRTLGKMAMGLRVVRDDGGPITFRHALVRSVVGLALERPGVILLGLGTALAMFVMVFNRDGKRIGDAWAGTIVLQERVTGAGVGFLPYLPPSLAPWAARLDLTAVDDRLALAIRQFLTRVHRLDPAARAELGRRLVAEVAARTAPPAPPGTPGWAYLTAVLAERRRREEARLAALRAVVPPTHPAGPFPGQGAAAPAVWGASRRIGTASPPPRSGQLVPPG
jgi:uncharacterized RDD family membrane protein YckC